MPIPLNVVVVDDSHDDARSVEEFVKAICADRNLDLSLSTHTTVLAAAQDCSRRRPDILFADYHFATGMTGYSLLARLEDPFAFCVYVLMSARERRELDGVLDKAESAHGERFAFLHKPITEGGVAGVLSKARRQLYIESRPQPLASVWCRLPQFSEPLESFMALKDLAEQMVQWSVVGLLCALRACGSAQQYEPVCDMTRPLSFGAWLRWLDDLAKRAADAKSGLSPVMSNLAELWLAEPREGDRPLQILRLLKDDRDTFIGHGIVRDAEWYRSLCERFRAPLSVLYNSLWPLSRMRICSVEGSEVCEKDIYRYRLKIFAGNDEVGRMATVSTSEILKTNSTYCVFASGEFIPMSPFASIEFCRECKAPRVFCIDHILAGKVSYSSLCGHKVDSAQGYEDLVAHWPLLANRACTRK